MEKKISRKRMFFYDPSITENSRVELNEYRKNGKFSDYQICAPDGTVYKVHKVIMALSCPFFTAAIQTGKDVLKLEKNIPVDDMNIILDYLYMGRTKIPLSKVKLVYEYAGYFELKELQDFCSTVIKQNLNLNNSLEFLRHSVGCGNIDVKDECLRFITENYVLFFNEYLAELTIDEIQIIASHKKVSVNQELLYYYLTKWIKENFEKRQMYLSDLIRNIDFSQTSKDFIERNVLSDKTLQKNKEFFDEISNQVADLKKISILLEKSKPALISSPLTTSPLPILATSPLENEIAELEKSNINQQQQQQQQKKLKIVLGNQTNIYLISNSTIDKLDNEGRKKMRQYTFSRKKLWGCAVAGYKDNIFISRGCNKDYNSTMNFECFETTTGTTTALPNMNNCCFHRMVQLNQKIYSCGGFGNNGAVNVYDIETSKWTKGVEMNEHKCDFGLLDQGNCIYAIGGYINSSQLSDSIERFDNREGEWYIISKTPRENFRNKAVLLKDSIYCVDMFSCGNIFEIRANKWRENISSKGVKNPGKSFWWCYDIVKYDEQIFGIFQSSEDCTSQTWKTYKYDHLLNVWNDLKRPLHMEAFADINLCVI